MGKMYNFTSIALIVRVIVPIAINYYWHRRACENYIDF